MTLLPENAEVSEKNAENADFSEKNAELGYALKRDLSIPRAAIFEFNVCLGTPSFFAAPNGPEMRPRDSISAASIISRFRVACLT